MQSEMTWNVVFGAVCTVLMMGGLGVAAAAAPGDAGAEADAESVKRVAVITTEYRHNSHSDVLASRLFQTDTLDGKGETFQLEIASMYVDQFPDNDTSRQHAAGQDFHIHDTIADALTLGTGELAVDGVLLITEHGDYPQSETGQTLYPKRRMFDEVVAVFESSGRTVPVFMDKFLAPNWENAKHIYDTAQEMDIPMIAGSVLPVGYRRPAVDLPRGAAVDEVVALSYGSLASYGFHGLEMLQSIVERRQGGESGVVAVQCLTGEAVWAAGEQGVYDRKLLDEAMSRLSKPRLGEDETLREAVDEPVAFVIEYADGLKATVLTLYPQAVVEWAIAWQYADDASAEGAEPGGTQSTLFWTQEARPFMHFTYQMQGIEQMIQTGEPTWPVERTLMTTGLLDALLISKQQGGKRIETPHLEFSYQSDWDWQAPPPPPPGRPIMAQ